MKRKNYNKVQQSLFILKEKFKILLKYIYIKLYNYFVISKTVERGLITINN